MNKQTALIVSATLALTTLALPAQAATSMQSCPQLEVGFSPEGGAEEVVLKSIASARKDIKILAYSFTSKTVVAELTKAIKRGVTVAVVADDSNNTSRYGVAALSTLVNAGAAVRTVSAYKIMHDKSAVIDQKTVQFGSFNYSKAAAQENSENAQVCWNAPGIAAVYLSHWQSRWDRGVKFQPRY